MSTKKSPREADAKIGATIRRIRMARGMSQEKLGEAIGITFQQIQKYEKGTNRVGGSRMSEIARVLGVPVSQLFEGADTPESAIEPVPTMDAAAMEVARMMMNASPTVRIAIRNIVRSVTEAVETAEGTIRKAA